MKGIILGCITALSVTLTACASTGSSASSETNIREVINSPEAILVDVRIPEQYEAGTAKNAVNIPLAELSGNMEALKGKKVIVFCNKGIQADQAMEILKKNGVDAYDGTTWKNVKAIQDEKQSGK